MILLSLGKSFPSSKFPVQHRNDLVIGYRIINVDAPLRHGPVSEIHLFLSGGRITMPQHGYVGCLLSSSFIYSHAETDFRKESSVRLLILRQSAQGKTEPKN